MDLWRLKVFCKVISTGGFSSAARELRLTQPSVSSHVKELESHFNCKLIDRINKQAKPTKAGEILYRASRRLIKEYEKIETTLSEYHGRYKGLLSIGGSNIPGEYILPSMLGSFRQAYPEVVISLLVRNTEDIIEQIIDDVIELGFVGAAVNDSRIFQEACFSDEMCLIVPAGNDWYDKDEIDLADLNTVPFISRKQGSGTMKTFRERVKKQGFDFRQISVVAELGSTTAVIQGIKNNLGASVLSTIAVRDELSSGILKSVRIKGVDLKRSFYLTCMKNRSQTPLAKLFTNFMKGIR